SVRINSSYSTKSAFGVTVDGQIRLVGRLGLVVGYASSKRDETGSYEASLPHPLYLNRPRTASGELSGMQIEARAFHADLAVVGSSGRWAYAVFGGPSFFSVTSDVVDHVTYGQAYPYDTVTQVQPSIQALKDSPVGWNVGGRLDYRLGAAHRFAVGAQ